MGSSAKVTSLTTKPLKEFQPVLVFFWFFAPSKIFDRFLEGKRAPPFYFFRLTTTTTRRRRRRMDRVNEYREQYGDVCFVISIKASESESELESELESESELLSSVDSLSPARATRWAGELRR